jgi:hypothetical protein
VGGPRADSLQGTDVREHVREVDTRLRQVELESIEDYIAESDNLMALHQHIQTCDGILQTMESLLGGFQADLGSISTEVRMPPASHRPSAFTSACLAQATPLLFTAEVRAYVQTFTPSIHVSCAPHRCASRWSWPLREKVSCLLLCQC